MARALALVVLCAAPALALAQPHRPPPQPAVSTPPPLPPKVKPAPIYDACFGPLVFLSSKTWRECCVLCDAGSDAPSAEEKAEAEAARTCNQNTTVNQYFSVAGRSIYGGNDGNGNGGNGGGNGGNGGNLAANAKPPSPFARNESGSLNGLRPLRPRAGGFE